jgi:hypothetical protein
MNENLTSMNKISPTAHSRISSRLPLHTLLTKMPIDSFRILGENTVFDITCDIGTYITLVDPGLGFSFSPFIAREETGATPESV